MPTFSVTAPDGSEFDIDAPDGATEQQIKGFAAREFTRMQGEKRKAQASAYAGEDVGQMGPLSRFVGGAKARADEIALGIKGLLPQAVQDAGDWVDRQFGSAGIDKEGAQAFAKEGGTAATLGGLAADVGLTAVPGMQLQRGAMALRALPRVGAALGNPLSAAALSGAAVGAATNPDDRMGGAKAGAIGGALGEGGGRVLQRTFGGIASRGVTPEARELMEQGIDVPLWKATENRVVRNLGERARALPVLGEAMKRQERTAIEQWNRGLVDAATPPLPMLDEARGVLRWEQSPIKSTGQQGLRDLGERFNAAYDAVYRGRSIPLDDAFARELDSISSNAAAYLPGESAAIDGVIRRVNDTLRAGTETTRNTSAILDASGAPFTSETLGHAGITPQQVKTALNDLNDSVTSAWRSGNADRARELEAVRDAVQALRERGLPPEVAAELAPVNAAYANFKTLQRAAGTLGAARQGGVVTPRQILNATRAADKSPGKSAFAAGRARGQQGAQTAESVLGNELPEVGPGTAEKLMLAGAFGVGWVPAAALGGLALGTRQGQRFLQGGYGFQELARRNPEMLADILRSYGVSQANTN